MAGFNYINENGIIVADTLTTLADSQQAFRDAAGDQNLTVDSGPLSVLINSFAEIQDGVAKANAQMANQINPRLSGGVALAAVMALTGSSIGAGVKTRVTATATGTAGAPIPKGSIVLTNPTITGIQHSFESENNAIIEVGGTVDIEFIARDYGPIVIPPASLTSISTPAIGWLSVSNSDPGITGRDQQSDSKARFSRIEQIGVQSSTLPARTYGAVSAITDVKSLTYYNNTEPTDVVVDGRTILSNSQYVCIDGGSDADIIEALAKAESGGCRWTGIKFGDYTDEFSFKPYAVRWDETIPIQVDIEVTIRPLGTSQDPEITTKEGVQAYADGLVDGFRGFVTGSDVNPFEVVEALNEFSNSINAIKCRVALDGQALDFDNVPMNINQKASILSSNITVILL